MNDDDNPHNDHIIDVQARRPTPPHGQGQGQEGLSPGRAQAQERAESLKSWGWVSYILHLIVAVAAVVPGAQVSVALLIIALVMDLVKKDDAIGSWQESHFRWRIRSVLWAGVLYVATAPLFLLLYLPGAIAWALISIWFLYRIVKGMVRMAANQSVDG